VFQKRLHRPTFDKIDMAYIKTPYPNRDIVKVLKIQHGVYLNGVTQNSKYKWKKNLKL